MAVTVVMFEGGPHPQGRLGAAMVGLRSAVALDTLEHWAAAPGVERVVLATNRPELAHQALRLALNAPVDVWPTPSGAAFHFGQELLRVVGGLRLEQVVYLGGASLPLLASSETDWVVGALEADPRCVVMNNVQSADLVAWRPGEALAQIELPAEDNFLGNLLRETGLERLLMPHSGAVHFDLDTPTDYLIMEASGRAGERTKAALAELDWDRSRVQAVAGLLHRRLQEIGLIGRVGTPVQEYISRNMALRLRVFSEERGMKALHRDADGLVRSVLAGWLEAVGPVRFWRSFAEVCHAVFCDSRVLFAHGGRRVDEQDRWASDLGLVDQIRDPQVRAFTAAALDCGVPVVLGGHTAVTGGLWILAEQAAPSHFLAGVPAGAGPNFGPAQAAVEPIAAGKRHLL